MQSSISSCKGCPLGKYLTLTSAKGSVNCFSCAPGRYAKESHSTSCEHCPEGWLQEAEGQPNCSRPVAGKIAAGGASSVKISPGWFATDCDEDTGVCKTQKVCEAGSKGNKERTRCDPCEAGTTSFQGSISCIPCSKGKFAASEGSTCAKCPSGFYQSNDDTPSVDCVACPQGWGPVLDEGMNEVDGSALCRDLNWKKAEDCTKDQYLDNRFLNNPSNWSCVTCPQGGACNGLATWSTLGPLFGWWKVPESERPSEQFMFTRCLYPPACLGAANLAFKSQYVSEIKTDLAMIGVISGVNASNTTCAIHLGFRNESRLCHTCNSTSRRKK